MIGASRLVLAWIVGFLWSGARSRRNPVKAAKPNQRYDA